VVGRLKGNFFTSISTRRAPRSSGALGAPRERARVAECAGGVARGYKPLGTWGSAQLVSVDGEVFTANQGEPTKICPRSTVPDGSARSVARYRDFEVVCAAEGGA
jgi:cell division protein FtsQ